MSKSIGNVLLVRDLLGSYAGEAIRLALMLAKYREPLNWSDELAQQASAQLDRLYGALQRFEEVAVAANERVASAAFQAAMDNDLNTPQAITVMMDTVTLAQPRPKTSMTRGV